MKIILNWKLKETGYEDVDWTLLAQDAVPTGRRVPHDVGFFEQLNDYQLLNKDRAPRGYNNDTQKG